MGILSRLLRKREVDSSIKGSPNSKLHVKEAEKLYHKGVDCMHSNEWPKALGYLANAAELSPDFPPCWYALGLTYGKLSAEGVNEEQLQVYSKKICFAFEKAADLSDIYGGLELKHYQIACLSSGTFYRIGKQYDSAIRLFKKALEKIPHDPDLLESAAICFFEKGNLDEAEKIVVNLLNIVSDSESGRKLWKKIRKKAGKSLTADLPEEKRKAIYSGYMGSQEDTLFLEPDILDGVKKAKTPRQMKESLEATGKRTREKAKKKIMESHGITAFELRLVIEEGKRKAWPFSSFSRLAADRAQPQRERFRDSLQCVHCGKRNVAPFWPENGDKVAFYYQSEERTQEQPGQFRLPIECPFCGQIWFVVWDTSPDPLVGQFIHHIERMCEAHSSNEKAVKALRSLIVDEILDEHMKFIRKEFKNAIENRQKSEHHVTTEEYFSTITLVPAYSPSNIRRYLGGSYFGYLDTVLADADIDNKITVHWVFACDNQNVAVHMLFLPKKSSITELTTIFPIDLLTTEERSQVGL